MSEQGGVNLDEYIMQNLAELEVLMEMKRQVPTESELKYSASQYLKGIIGKNLSTVQKRMKSNCPTGELARIPYLDCSTVDKDKLKMCIEDRRLIQNAYHQVGPKDYKQSPSSQGHGFAISQYLHLQEKCDHDSNDRSMDEEDD